MPDQLFVGIAQAKKRDKRIREVSGLGILLLIVICLYSNKNAYGVISWQQQI